VPAVEGGLEEPVDHEHGDAEQGLAVESAAEGHRPEANHGECEHGRGGHPPSRRQHAADPLAAAAAAQGGAVFQERGLARRPTLKDGLAAWMARSLAKLDIVDLSLDALTLRVRSAGKV
jgi:hypothetical protein